MAAELLPSILVSFAYAKPWTKVSHLPWWRECVLDSGAFSAFKSGKKLDLLEYAEWVKSERARDTRVTECFTLDVIGGTWQESLRNTEALWKLGVNAIPVFHVGEPTDVLKSLARDYPKIALGGAVGYSRKMEWAALCFREVWPKKIHGLGYGHDAVKKLPFHTIDASSWFFESTAFGNYPSMGGLRDKSGTSVLKNDKKNWLYCEVEFQLRAEHTSRGIWAGRLPADFGAAPSIRLATDANEKAMRSLSPARIGVRQPLPAKE